MRDSLKSTAGWLMALPFLALPNCSFQVQGLDPLSDNLNRGAKPHTSAIFCDIEQERHCATQDDLAPGKAIKLSQAAVALARRQSSQIGLDYSPGALGRCGGQPEAVVFRDAFPEGRAVCLNCGVIGPNYADVNAACVAACEIHPAPDPPSPETMAFCQQHARASTNAQTCVAGVCTDAGAPRSDFEDPRRIPEPVVWTNVTNVTVTGADLNSLTKMAGTSGQFDAGAASSQLITSGDGYVEFTATETDKVRLCGLAVGGADNDPSATDITFGARLSATIPPSVYIQESGTVIPGTQPNGSFGTYAAGDRVRLTVIDNFDGTATITYSLIPAACAGPGCDGMALRTAGPAPYPFRVDASLRDQGATLTDVRIVRIQ